MNAGSEIPLKFSCGMGGKKGNWMHKVYSLTSVQIWVSHAAHLMFTLRKKQEPSIHT